MKDDAYRPHGRPECLDSFLAEAAIVIDSERQRGLTVDQLARKMSKRRQDVANTFYRLNVGEYDRFGFSLPARILETLGYRVRVVIERDDKRAAA